MVTSPHPTEPSGLLTPQGISACKGQTLTPYHLPNTAVISLTPEGHGNKELISV